MRLAAPYFSSRCQLVIRRSREGNRPRGEIEAEGKAALIEPEGAVAFRNRRDSSTLEAFLGKHFPSSFLISSPSLVHRRQPAGEYKISIMPLSNPLKVPLNVVRQQIDGYSKKYEVLNKALC
jgi:hypothetical protein